MNIVSVNLGNLVIAAQSFVFGIQHKIILIKVGIAHTTMVVKQVDTTFMQLVFRMNETYITQNGIDIFLPKPCPIKQYTADFIITLAIFYLFHPENLKAECL